LHDSIRLERQGIPAVAVATHEFLTAARVQASLLGRPDFDPVAVPHPIQDQTPDEIAGRAKAAVEEIVRRLLVPG